MLSARGLALIALPAVFLGVGLTFLTPARAADQKPLYDENADAHRDVKNAIAKAAKQRKNVMLVFGANWCGDCHALHMQMEKPPLASIIAKNYVVVDIDVGRFNKNQDLAEQYHVPLKKGIPALAVLDAHGSLLHSLQAGEFADARHMAEDAFVNFFEQWKPKG
jgi:thiol-disulfide isomerase/thioredoxin